jgi:dihydrofolate synthase / folylpolyglutamate synthase
MNVDSIDSLNSAQDFLSRQLQDSSKKLFSEGEGLERAKTWFKGLGDPQDAFKAIHVAGTSGKGSTSYLISALLHAAGHVVGTHVSPHVYDIRERMLLNNNCISSDEFTARVRSIVPSIAAMEQQSVGGPTYYEVTMALAMQLFQDKQVDYGVVETGMGGRYDASNTISRTDKVAVITRLGFDHTEILGNTIEEIAWQKGGIIPEHGVVFALLPHEEGAVNVLQTIAEERQAELRFVDPSQYVTNIRHTDRGIHFRYESPHYAGDLFIALLGDYQLENAALAMEVVAYVAQRDGWELTIDHIEQALTNLRIPARAERRQYRGHPLILDSAHNPQKLEAFFSLIDSLALDQKPRVIFAAKKSKDWQASLPLLSNAAETLYFTEFFHDQPGLLREYAVTSNEFIAQLRDQAILNGTVGYIRPIDSLHAALSESTDGQAIIVVGSMYMLGELNAQLEAEAAD